MFQTQQPAAPLGAPFFPGAPLNNPVPQQPPSISVDTRFTDLPEEYRSILERTSTDFKKPMHDGLDAIARYNPKILEELNLELRRTNLIAMQLKCRQEQLMAEIGTFQEEAKSNLRNVRKFGNNGLLQIQDRGGIASARAYLMNEELPTDFYREAVEKIEIRLRGCATDIDHLQKQLSATMAAMNDYDPRAPAMEGMGVYGQQMRIVPQQLVRLIQHQGEAFVRVAASVAEVHREADAMRAAYRRLYFGTQHPGGGGPYHAQQAMDPFAKADKIEEAKERILSRRLQDEELRHTSSKAPTTDITQQPQQAQAQQQPAANMFNFNQPAAAAATPAPTGFGGFGAAAFGAPKPATPAAPAAGFGGFGGFGAAPAAAAPVGFGAPAAPAAAAPANLFGGFGGFGGAFGGGAGIQNTVAGDLAIGGGTRKNGKSKK